MACHVSDYTPTDYQHSQKNLKKPSMNRLQAFWRHIKWDGFRRNHSTMSALMDITDDVIKKISWRLLVPENPALLDFMRAFDCIIVDTLMKKKLRCCGPSVNTCNWFSSYFSDRCQVLQLTDSWGKSCGGCCQLPEVTFKVLFLVQLCLHSRRCTIWFWIWASVAI